MILGVNEIHEICTVGSVGDGLTLVEVDDIYFTDKDPLDFRIEIDGNEVKITPKWDYEMKQVARKENAEIKECMALMQKALDDLILGGTV